MNSMRRFLLITLFIATSLLAVLEGLWSYRQGTHEIDEVFDAQLAQYARTLLGLIDHAAGPASIRQLKDRLAASEYHHNLAHHPYEAQLGFQIWRGPDDIIGQSPSLPERALVPLAPGYQRGEVDGQDWLFFTLYDDEHQRWIVAGQSTAVREELAMRFALHDLSSALALVLALGIAVVMIMRIGLAPLDRLARQVAQRDAGALRSVDSQHLPLELQPLVASINSAFDRLDNALERERQFTDDAAHELRTPVSIIQTRLENALAGASPASRPELESALQATRSLGQLIIQLLELARLGPDSSRTTDEAVDLHGLAADQISLNLAAIDHKGLQVSLEGEDEAWVEGDSRLLAVLVRNLLDNAIKYTPEGGQVQVRISTSGETCTLLVSDSGPGIPMAQRQRALQRFCRLPAQQALAGVSGCGLGLTLVATICQLHGAVLALADAPIGGLQVSVAFARSRHA